MTSYLFRLDDICPTLRWNRFTELADLFNQYQIKPILAVVADNQDSALMVDPPNPDFWPYIAALAARGWIIAQHGFQHVYLTKEAGLLKLRFRSEFAGRSYAIQYDDIQRGQQILMQRLNQPITWWSAPAHSFDTTTCQALVNLKFTHISDGIALYPFRRYGLTWIPHQTWSIASKPLGVWTIGIHLNTMRDRHVARLRRFLAHHAPACHPSDLRPREDKLNLAFRPLWYLQYRLQRALT